MKSALLLIKKGLILLMPPVRLTLEVEMTNILFNNAKHGFNRGALCKIYISLNGLMAVSSAWQP